MATKKSLNGSSKPITEAFLSKQIGKVLEVVKDNRKYLEDKIESSRQSSKEQLESVERRLHAKIDTVHDKLDMKIDGVHDKLDAKINGVHDKLDMKIEAVHDKLNYKIMSVQTDLSEIKQCLGRVEQKLDNVVEKVERHDGDIASLKSAVS